MIKRSLLFLLSVFIAIQLVFITAVPALAFDARSGTDVTIASGEIIEGDLYIAANNVTIDGTINGDIFAAGQIVRINGKVNGGVTLAGQAITINGSVANGARLAGQTVSISGKIGRDLMVIASDLTVNKSAVIGRDINSHSNSAVIDGRIDGNVTGAVNSLTISGGITGNVIVTVSRLELTSTANIMGNLNYTSNNPVDIKAGATLNGTSERIVPIKSEPSRGLHRGVVGALAFGIFAFLSIFVIGLITIYITRRYIITLALTIHDHPVSSLGWGSLCFFITPLAAFTVMLTIIGIPLGLISLGIWGILLYLAQIPVALLIGWMILSRKREKFSYGFLVGLMALGLACLYIIGSIPVVGAIMWISVMIFGLGSLTAAYLKRQKNILTIPAQ